MQRELNVSLVVYFYTDWCPYCRTLNEQDLSSPAVNRALQRSVPVRINPEYVPEFVVLAFALLAVIGCGVATPVEGGCELQGGEVVTERPTLRARI